MNIPPPFWRESEVISLDQPPTFFHKINDFPLIYGNNQGKTLKNTKNR